MNQIEKELPSPSQSKQGWPWAEFSQSLPEKMPDGSDWPKISIITPSYNQGKFIEETIRSVLLQNYPNLEYIIVDGKSNDETQKIIEKYRPWFSKVIIEPDNGAADAIRKGMEIATGEWFNWINSDDWLLPNSLSLLAYLANLYPEYNWISGGRININTSSQFVSSHVPWKQKPNCLLFGGDFFPQDATFFKLSFLQKNNLEINTKVKNVFDTLLYNEALLIEKPLLTSGFFSAMRWHESQLTANTKQREIESTYIKAIKRKNPNYILIKIAQRLVSTRFKYFIILFLMIIAKLQLWPPAKAWKACVYNPWQRQFIECDAKDCWIT